MPATSTSISEDNDRQSRSAAFSAACLIRGLIWQAEMRRFSFHVPHHADVALQLIIAETHWH